MANQPRFDVEDIERLFRALIPSGLPDPFGRLEKLLQQLHLDQNDQEEITDLHREELFKRLDSIQRRTFGILILQIFRTIKLFMGFLPQGRIILIIIAVLGLGQMLLEDGEVSVGSIRDAVASTGIAKFIDDIMEQIKEQADLLANHTMELANATSEIFVSVSARVDQTSSGLTLMLNGLSSQQYETVDEMRIALDIAYDQGLSLASGLVPAGNAAANGADLIGPALRAIDDRIREFPDLALRLVTLR